MLERAVQRHLKFTHARSVHLASIQPPTPPPHTHPFHCLCSITLAYLSQITIELLGAPSYAARLRSLVHAPPDVDIGHARANPAGGHGSSSSSSGSGSSGSSGSSGGNVGRPPVPAAIKTRLATENALDLALYREWRARQEACAG